MSILDIFGRLKLCLLFFNRELRIKWHLELIHPSKISIVLLYVLNIDIIV